MAAPTGPVRIAHAYGNSRGLLRRALAANIDVIEADVWYRARDIWVRHERRLGPIPLLLDKQMAGHRLLPLSLALWRGYYLRPEFPPLRLSGLLAATQGKKRLLLDVKGHYTARQAAAFARTLAARITEHGAETWAAVCGQVYAVLDNLREVAPQIEVRYSVERPTQWKTVKHMISSGASTSGLCMQRRLATEKRLRLLAEQGIGVYCWTVDDIEEARRLLGLGAEGIISNNLALLAKLVPGPR